MQKLISFSDLKPYKGIGYSRDHLRRMVKEGRFPRPMNLSSARIAWQEAEVDAWIEAKARERSQDISE